MRKYFVAAALFLAVFFLGVLQAQASRTLYPWFIGGGYSQNFFLNYSKASDDVYRLGRLGFGGHLFVGRQISDHWGILFDNSLNMHIGSRRGTDRGIVLYDSTLLGPTLHFTREPLRSGLDPYIFLGPGIAVSTKRVLNNHGSPYPILGGFFGFDYYTSHHVSMYAEVGSLFAIRYMMPAVRVGMAYHFGHPRVVIFDE